MSCHDQAAHKRPFGRTVLCIRQNWIHEMEIAFKEARDKYKLVVVKLVLFRNSGQESWCKMKVMINAGMDVALLKRII